MDRIDIHIETPAVKIDELQDSQKGESSSAIRERVESCRDLQKQRYHEFGLTTHTNATIPQNLMDLKQLKQVKLFQNPLWDNLNTRLQLQYQYADLDFVEDYNDLPF